MSGEEALLHACNEEDCIGYLSWSKTQTSLNSLSLDQISPTPPKARLVQLHVKPPNISISCAAHTHALHAATYSNVVDKHSTIAGMAWCLAATSKVGPDVETLVTSTQQVEVCPDTLVDSVAETNIKGRSDVCCGSVIGTGCIWGAAVCLAELLSRPWFLCPRSQFVTILTTLSFQSRFLNCNKLRRPRIENRQIAGVTYSSPLALRHSTCSRTRRLGHLEPVPGPLTKSQEGRAHLEREATTSAWFSTMCGGIEAAGPRRELEAGAWDSP